MIFCKAFNTSLKYLIKIPPTRLNVNFLSFQIVVNLQLFNAIKQEPITYIFNGLTLYKIDKILNVN